MATMKAIDINPPTIKGSPIPASAMYINPSIPKPTPKPCQALIHIKAFGLNRMDLLQRTGNYPVPPQAPKTLGVEFSGIITDLGDQSTNEFGAREHFAVGDEVFGLAYGGAYAEYIVVSTHMLIRKPKELSWVQAAGVPEVWITATQALYLVGGFEEGKSVLWHAGASSVSIAGIQLARGDGASKVFASVRQDSKVTFCEELGCDKAFNTEKEDWVKGVKDATDGKGVDLIVDFVGGPNFEKNLDVLARDGTMVMLGLMGGVKTEGPLDLLPILYKRLAIKGSTLRARDEQYQGKLRDMLEDHALPKFKDGSFKIVIEKEMDWSEIVKAHEMMERNETKGKIVCTIPWE